MTTEEEIKMMIDEGREKGTIEKEEKEMFSRQELVLNEFEETRKA